MLAMKIEVGKTYEINAYFKKSMFEIEQFKNEETGQMLNTEMWRNGTFYVKVMNIQEAADLQSCLYIQGEQEEPEIWTLKVQACEMTVHLMAVQKILCSVHHFTEEQQDS